MSNNVIRLGVTDNFALSSVINYVFEDRGNGNSGISELLYSAGGHQIGQHMDIRLNHFTELLFILYAHLTNVDLLFPVIPEFACKCPGPLVNPP